jgi:hypothetical protein
MPGRTEPSAAMPEDTNMEDVPPSAQRSAEESEEAGDSMQEDTASGEGRPEEEEEEEQTRVRIVRTSPYFVAVAYRSG